PRRAGDDAGGRTRSRRPHRPVPRRAAPRGGVDRLRPGRGSRRERRGRSAPRAAAPLPGRRRGRPLQPAPCLRADLMPLTYATTTVRPGPQGNAFLSLENQACGLIGNLSGGATYADVIEEKMGPSYITKKHLGWLRYEEFSLDIGFTMAEPVFD